MTDGGGQILVAGSWHLASTLAAGLAELGHTVVGCDDDIEAIAALAAARPPVNEPGLDALLRRHLETGRLRFTTNWAQALADATVAFVAHDTPVGEDDSPDVSVVERTVETLARSAIRPLTLVISSQVPVGTCERLAALARSRRPDLRWEIACCPEFLRLGEAIDCFLNPDRVVVGAGRPEVAADVRALLPPRAPTVLTDLATAEMVKHATNAFLATSISFINEVADLSAERGADGVTVAAALRLDRRIGPHAALAPGLGFAGGTLGRDVRALQRSAQAVGLATVLLDAVMTVNERRLPLLLAQLRQALADRPRPVACLLGLTYKPRTSTLRRSASLRIARELLASGWRVRAHDAAADVRWASELPAGLELRDDPLDAADGAHAVAILTEWPQYRAIDLRLLRERMAGDWLFDARNVIDPETAARAGFRYRGVGRRLAATG